MKTRLTSVAAVIAVPGAHRRRPVSVAVSMALLAAAASAMAAEPTAAGAETAGAPEPAQQDVPATPPPDARKARSGASGPGADEGAREADLETITIVGVRESQMRAIEVKRV